MKADLDQLLGAVHLGGDVGLRAGADVAGNAIHVRVRGDFVRGVLGVHHVATLPAELRRIHICRAAITGHRDHQQIDDGGCQHNIQAMAEDPVIQIDLGKFGGNLARFLQLSDDAPRCQPESAAIQR